MAAHEDFTTTDDIQEKSAREVITAIANRLLTEADDRVSKRDPIEKRWLEDLAQYHGKYDETISTDLREHKKSSLFINQTRPKTNAMESRLSDMLFPTDDRNWGIQPTPVPELTIEAEFVAKAAADAKIAAVDAPDDEGLKAESENADDILNLLESRLDEAKKRARAMEEEIDDHLRESKYAIQAREVIKDGCKFGTGIMKGPMTDGKARRAWVPGQPEQPEQSEESEPGENIKNAEGSVDRNVFELKYEDDAQPAFWRVDPWNFFPDMDAMNMAESESEFERHLMSKKRLRRLARQPGFDRDAIRRLLMAEPRATVPSYLADLRAITSTYNDMLKNRYHVWEYHGPLAAEDMVDLAVAMEQGESVDDLDEEVDPLDEIQVVIWFCQGEILKFGLHHLDSGDSIYSVWNLEKDEASIFGFGIPHIMRDPQKALSGAWRVLMDNMGLSSGPQIVINEDVIDPVDGKWEIVGRKLWRRKGSAAPDKVPFETFNIPSHMDELLAVIDVSKTNIDEETALPMLAQGEQGTAVTKTAQGMSILMNSVNVVFRRIVKNWDDDMTTENIRRMYDWLMQFSPKEYIKGDMQVDARGTSVLLVREMQSANMMAFLMNFGGHPILGKYLKDEGLPALRRLANTMMIPADEVIKTDTEIAGDKAEAAQEDPIPDPEMEKIAASLNLERLKGETALQLEGMRRETALITLASTQNLDLEKLQAMLGDKQADRDSKERIFAAEAAMTERVGKGGGGYL